MSPANLRVLRSEQSSGNLPGIKNLAMQKDHLANISPLSMVGDKRERTGRNRRVKLQRKQSWRDTIRGLTQSGDEDMEAHRSGSGSGKSGSGAGAGARQGKATISKPGITPSASRVFIGRRERATTLPATVATIEDRDGGLADAESDDAESEAEADYAQMREQDRPIEARIRHIYPHIPAAIQPLPTSAAVLEKQQEALSAAVAEADTKAITGGKGEEGKTGTKGKQGEQIGTRLTMTSRTGYFQDRIISPSMVSKRVISSDL